MLPDPNTEQAQAQIREYLLQVIRPFLDENSIDEVTKMLESGVKAFAEFGNMLLLEPTGWEWNYTHAHQPPDDHLVVFPAFRQVRDLHGDPTEGAHDRDEYYRDAHVVKVDETPSTH